jgi:hypothetical protein
MRRKSEKDAEKWENERYSEFAACWDLDDWWPMVVSRHEERKMLS